MQSNKNLIVQINLKSEKNAAQEKLNQQVLSFYRLLAAAAHDDAKLVKLGLWQKESFSLPVHYFSNFVGRQNLFREILRIAFLKPSLNQVDCDVFITIMKLEPKLASEIIGNKTIVDVVLTHGNEKLIKDFFNTGLYLDDIFYNGKPLLEIGLKQENQFHSYILDAYYNSNQTQSDWIARAVITLKCIKELAGNDIFARSYLGFICNELKKIDEVNWRKLVIAAFNAGLCDELEEVFKHDFFPEFIADLSIGTANLALDKDANEEQRFFFQLMKAFIIEQPGIFEKSSYQQKMPWLILIGLMQIHTIKADEREKIEKKEDECRYLFNLETKKSECLLNILVQFSTKCFEAKSNLFGSVMANKYVASSYLIKNYNQIHNERACSPIDQKGALKEIQKNGFLLTMYHLLCDVNKRLAILEKIQGQEQSLVMLH